MGAILKDLSVQYVKQPILMGKPDFQLLDYNVLIFCDSSFWHGRNPSDVSGKNFKRNRELWVDKLTKTKARDVRISKALKDLGFDVLRFGDDEIYKTPDKCRERILEKISLRNR